MWTVSAKFNYSVPHTFQFSSPFIDERGEYCVLSEAEANQPWVARPQLVLVFGPPTTRKQIRFGTESV